MEVDGLPKHPIRPESPPPGVMARICRPARTVLAALLALLTTGCGDVTTPGTEVLSTEELLILPFQSAAPEPQQQSSYIVNSRTTVHPIVHPDPFSTRFLEVRFPSGCIVALGGQAVGDSDSVQVTIGPRAGTYGFTLTPEDMILTSTCGATAALFFARYGDLSVADGSSTYLDRAAFAAALDLWLEVSPNRWRVVSGSAGSGSDAVEGAIEQAGSFVVAAPR